MDIKEKVKYFYECITSNNIIEKVEDYISDNCCIRYGNEVFPVGVEGMKQHMIDVGKLILI